MKKKTRFWSGCSDFDLVDLGGVLVLVVEVRDERVDDGQEVPAFGRLFRDSMWKLVDTEADAAWEVYYHFESFSGKEWSPTTDLDYSSFRQLSIAQLQSLSPTICELNSILSLAEQRLNDWNSD